MDLNLEFTNDTVKIFTDDFVYHDTVGSLSSRIAEWETYVFPKGFLIESRKHQYQKRAEEFIDTCFGSREKADKINGYLYYAASKHLAGKKYSVSKNFCVKSGEVIDTYRISNPIDLINLEIMYAIMNDMTILKCGSCGKYFVSNSSIAQYCDRVSADGRTCKQVGAKKQFVEKMKTDDVLLLYERTYQATYYKGRKLSPGIEKKKNDERLVRLKQYRIMYKQGELSGERFKKILEKYAD